MADGKNIEVRVAAVGADAAAAELQKVQAAAKNLEGGSTGFGGMLDGVPERAEETAEAVEKLAAAETKVAAAAVPMSEHLGTVADEMDDVANRAGQADERLSQIASVQRATAVAEMSQKIADLGRRMIASAEHFKESDPHMAASLKKVGTEISTVSDYAGSMASAFAVGGPVAAGLVLVGKLAVDAAVEFVDYSKALSGEAAAAARAEEMQGKLNLMLAGVIDPATAAAEASAQLTESYDLEKESLDELIDATERRNKILDARDKRQAAERDNADAEAIRNGAAPEDVKAARAMDDAAAEKARIDRELELKRLRENELRTSADDLRKQQQELEQMPGATDADKADARKKADDRRREADQAERDRITEEQVAQERKAAIDIRTEGKVASLTGPGGDKEKRLLKELHENAKEQDRIDAKAEAEAKREAEKAAAEAKRREDARRELETDGSKIGTDAAKAARGLGIEGHARTFERVGAFISKKSTSGSQDSDAASRMLKMIEDLVANAEKHGKANDPNTQKLRELEQRIEKLTQQMRNKNPGS